ncbi:MAG: aminotransferase class I/II-fold pyridoxal phosphate-dependent enzyme [Thermodesulfobacteriota bacterium]
MRSTSPLAVHGGNILATAKALGCAVSDLIDLSSNLTPFGTMPGLEAALVAGLAEIRFLPESGSESLCALFAEKKGIAASQVLAGNGTTEFIYAVPAAFGCQRAIIINPTYADYATACQWAGVPAEGFALDPAQGFRLDLDALAAKLVGGELLFLCNPNNPTGVLTPSAAIAELARQRPDSLFLVDESYLPFTRESSLLALGLPENLLVLFSASKIYGIPGLRLGFLAGSASRIARLGERVKPWGVNRLAQIAGEYALRHGDAYCAEVVRFVEAERPRVMAELAALPGVQPFDGAANFILSRLAGPVRAPELKTALLKERIMIRDCANFATLDDRYFRISLKEQPTNDHALAAMRAFFGVAP